MLIENPTLERPPSPSDEYLVQISRPDPAREGIIEVLTLRGLMRALRVALKQSDTDDFERALAKVINVNGAIAQAVEVERNRRRIHTSGVTPTINR